MNDSEFVSRICPIFGGTGWAYYFTPETIARGSELGLKGPLFYFAGRGGLLGDCDAAVVSAAFGYFNPAVVKSAWDAARAVVPPMTAGLAHWECCANLGRLKLASVDGLEAFVEAADAVNTAADPDGLALYAAFKAAPLADDLPGRAMQLVSILREFRGSAHLVAVRAAGISSKQAHFVSRPNDIRMFGWTPEDAPLVDDSVRAAMAEAERLTDRIVTPAYAVLNGTGRDALVAGAEAIKAALS